MVKTVTPINTKIKFIPSYQYSRLVISRVVYMAPIIKGVNHLPVLYNSLSAKKPK